MSLFDQLQAEPGQYKDQVAAIRQDVNQISSNPVNYLRSRGFDIPAGMTDPKQLTQHLLRTRQVPTSRLQQVMAMLGRR